MQRTITSYLASFPEWKRARVTTLHSAVIESAIALTDEEAHAVVDDGLVRARRMLSS